MDHYSGVGETPRQNAYRNIQGASRDASPVHGGREAGKLDQTSLCGTPENSLSALRYTSKPVILFRLNILVSFVQFTSGIPHR